MILKPKALSMAMVAICSAGSVVAGGADITLMPTEMMFEKGSYVEVSTVRVNPNVTSTAVSPTPVAVAPNNSMYSDYSANTLAFKMDLNDKIAVGFADYLSAGIYVDYRNDTTIDAFVDLSIRSRLLAVKYQVNENVSILGGWKHSKTSNASANVLKNPVGILTISSASDSALALGVAYEKPEIALRVSALYQSATKFDLPMSSSSYATLVNGKAGLPKSMTLRFQSGVAKDTLVFGTAHRGDWANSQIQFETDFDAGGNYVGQTGTVLARSSFTTTTAYTLGVGRKFSEKYAVSATYGWEKGSGATGSSLLSTTDGKKSLTLGGKYTNGRMTVSAGYSMIRFGDYTNTTSSTGVNLFSGNTANVIGLKLGFSL
jgi:long-chain fatty acid transport protein